MWACSLGTALPMVLLSITNLSYKGSHLDRVGWKPQLCCVIFIQLLPFALKILLSSSIKWEFKNGICMTNIFTGCLKSCKWLPICLLSMFSVYVGHCWKVITKKNYSHWQNSNSTWPLKDNLQSMVICSVLQMERSWNNNIK